MIKEAYELGVRQALEDAGLVKQAELTKTADPVDRTGHLFANQQSTVEKSGSPNVILDTSLDDFVRKLLDK